MSKLRTFLATTAMAFLAAGAMPVEAQKRGGQVNVVVQPEPPSLMLPLVQNGPTQMVAGNIYESLLKYDNKLNPLPSLAEKWSVSEDGKVYTFTIKQGVTWHDGKPFSIDDVVFTLDKFLRETHPRWRPVANAQIEKIEKADEATLKITLKNPFGPFILMFEVGTTPIVPKHIYEGTDYKTNPANNTPIGTGPFKFKEWNKGSFIQLVRNETYHVKGLPYLDTIYWQIIPDAAARAVAYETGKVDILTGGSVENSDIDRIKKVANTCITTEGWELFAPHSWVWINNRKEPMSNKLFRQGMMHAIDREFAKDVIWNGLGKVAIGPVSSSTKFFTADVPKYAYDPKKAKELILKSGYKGEKIRFLALPYGETWTRWAEAIRQNLIEAGVNVDLVTSDVAGYNQKISDWDYDLSMSYLYQYGDPAAGVARTYISSNIVKGNPFSNIEGYSNPEVDKLFAEAATATPDSKRQELYTKVQKILVEDVPVAWQTEMQFPTIYRCNVKNLIKTAIGINDAFGDAWKE
jgi:peptide/nickel transport system substrate-binding protein